VAYHLALARVGLQTWHEIQMSHYFSRPPRYILTLRSWRSIHFLLIIFMTKLWTWASCIIWSFCCYCDGIELESIPVELPSVACSSYRISLSSSIVLNKHVKIITHSSLSLWNNGRQNSEFHWNPLFLVTLLPQNIISFSTRKNSF
jgi:hypothetical protein